ncbi:MAG: general secretion pathway protein GspK, partial [Gammaproteobacteria bacterium]|nr:general secretion pathway protein GspK [Gammaproteobacteria bacterium]
EDKAYRAAGRPYAAKVAPFEAVDELQLVLGMPVAVFEKLEPFLTVYSGQGGVNQAAAPREVLLALPNADPDTVDSLLAERTSAGSDGAQASAASVYRISAHAQMPSGTTYGVRAVVQLSPTQSARFLVREWKEGV